VEWLTVFERRVVGARDETLVCRVATLLIVRPIGLAMTDSWEAVEASWLAGSRLSCQLVLRGVKLLLVLVGAPLRVLWLFGIVVASVVEVSVLCLIPIISLQGKAMKK